MSDELTALADEIDVFIKYGTSAIFGHEDAKKIATALRSYAAAQEQESVAWAAFDIEGTLVHLTKSPIVGIEYEPLYTAPQKPQPAPGWDEATRYLKKIADLVDDENACDPLDDAISYAKKALEALRSKPTDTVATVATVAVKPLEWVERNGVTGTFDASTSIGNYIATITDDDRGMWFIVGLTQSNYMIANIGAVQRAAQSDYESRIRSALTNQPLAVDSNASVEAKNALYWAVGRWNAEVLNRPLQNIHRRSLDDTWRQVIRHFGGDDRELCGPTHDDLVDSSQHPHASDCARGEETRYTCGDGHGSLEDRTDWCGYETTKSEVVCANCNGTRRSLYFGEQSMSHEERTCHMCRPSRPSISDHASDCAASVVVPASGIAKMMDAIQSPPEPNEALKKLLRGSGCARDGESMGDQSPSDPKDLKELLSTPSVLEPSDRTDDVTVEEQDCEVCGGDCSSANPPVIYCPVNDRKQRAGCDVTVDRLADFIVNNGTDIGNDESKHISRALLRAFTVGRR